MIYEIKLINQTVYFIEGTVKKTYQIVKKFAKSGIIRKITLGIATVVIVLSLTFGNGRAKAVEPINPTPMPIERVQPQQAQIEDLSLTDIDEGTHVDEIFLKIARGGDLHPGNLAWVNNPFQYSKPEAAKFHHFEQNLRKEANINYSKRISTQRI